MLTWILSSLAATPITYDPLNPPAAPLATPATALWALAGETTERDVVLTNKLATPLHLNEVLIVGPPGFVLDPAPTAVVAPGATYTVHVRWTPPAAETAETAVLLRAAEGATTLRIKGEIGVEPPPEPTTAGVPSSAIAGLVGKKGTQLGATPTDAAPAPPAPGAHRVDFPIILGALDKALIDQVIDAGLGRLDACYQAEKARTRSLSGRITVKFVVARDGTVRSAFPKESSFPSGNVEQCVATAFLGLRFPEPKGGGIVIASYPFSFAP